MIKIFFLIALGLIGGLWIPWPGITKTQNWDCAIDVVSKSNGERVDMRTLMSINLGNVFRKDNNGILGRLRIVGNACFR
tara:strand:- start:935 stop:1171 length:237 start_codon:yes stop_codon:yes gene_type:complete